MRTLKMARDEITKVKFKVIPWVGSSTPLRVFLETAGRAAYGKGWPSDAAKLLDTHQRQQAESYRTVRLMADEIISAGIAGKLKAMSGAQTKKARLIDGKQQFSIEGVAFDVQPSFWQLRDEGSSIKWLPSLARANITDVKLAGAAGYTAEFIHQGVEFESAESVEGSISISSPQYTLEALFGEMLLPDDPWMKRCSMHRKAFLGELITVGWRFLAVKRPNSRRGLIKEIEKSLWEYLKLQGIEPDRSFYPDAFINNIASNIHKQWLAGDVIDKALVNRVRYPKPKKSPVQTT